MFVPFVSDVRVCGDSGSSSSMDYDDPMASGDPSNFGSPPPGSSLASGSASGPSGLLPTPGDVRTKDGSRLTPPSSPHVGKERFVSTLGRMSSVHRYLKRDSFFRKLVLPGNGLVVITFFVEKRVFGYSLEQLLRAR